MFLASGGGRVLTERMKRFVEVYTGLGSGLDAVRAAGYTGDDETLKVRASKLIRHPEVAAAIEEKVAKEIAPAVIDVEVVLDDQQQAFVDAYVETGVLAESARRAGYPARRAYQLRRDPAIAAALEVAELERRELLVASRREREEFFAGVMRGEITETRYTMEGESYEASPLTSRMWAARELGRIQGDYLKGLVRGGVGDTRTVVKAKQALVFVDNRRGPAAAGGAGG